jgi:glucan biosynthesis protein C
MSTRPRLTYIDNLRTFLTILVIVLHAAVTYGSEGGWYYQEATQDMLAIVPLTIIAAILQSFFMGLFFFVAGYFTPGSYDRKGVWRYLLDRLLRLGIPCLLFFYGIGPLATYMAIVLLEGGEPVYAPHIGTMWFAQALLLLGIFYALVRAISRSKPDTETKSRFPAAWHFVLAGVAMAFLTWLVRYFYPRGTGMYGMIFGDFPQYILMFVAGIIAYRQNWLASVESVKQKWLWVAFVVLVLLLPVMMVLGEDPERGFDLFMGGLYWQAVAYASWESAMCIVVSLLLLQVFQKRYNAQSKLSAAMSAAAYTVYVIHPVVLLLVSYVLLPLPAHPLIKFVILAILGTVITFPLAGTIKRVPLLRSIL